jgi:hypothetical protein
MYPWLHPGPYALSTYSLLFLYAYVVDGICHTVSPGLHMVIRDVDEDVPGLRLP